MVILTAAMFLAWVWLFFFEGASGYYTVTTSDAVPHDFDLDFMFRQPVAFFFNVTACSDAFIRVKPNWEKTDNDVIIWIGEMGEPLSTMTDATGAELESYDHDSDPLDCQNSIAFWIYWGGNTLSVGFGGIVNTETFLSHEFETAIQFKFVSFDTLQGEGTWFLGGKCDFHGDPHVSSDDGKYFRISSIGIFILKRVHLPITNQHLDIFGEFTYCGQDRSCLNKIMLVHKEHNVELEKSGVSIDGNLITDELYYTQDHAIYVFKRSGHYKVEVFLDYGLTIKSNLAKSAEILTSLWFFDDTFGICGTLNLEKADEWTLRDEVTVAGDLSTFVVNWRETV